MIHRSDNLCKFLVAGCLLAPCQERMPFKVAEVTVPEQAEIRVDFDLGLGELQKF